ncbi:MAG: hypothetical protein AAGA93_20395 [Actinomycetota bacterium]
MTSTGWVHILADDTPVGPEPPVHPDDAGPVVRLEGWDGPAPATDADQPAGLVDRSADGSLGEVARRIRLDPVDRGPDDLVAPVSWRRTPSSERAQFLYRRQTAIAGMTLAVLLTIGAVTFPRSWGDPGPGLAVATGDGQVDPTVGRTVAQLVEPNTRAEDAINRGEVASPTTVRSPIERPLATRSATAAPDAPTTSPLPELPVPTVDPSVDTSATVGSSSSSTTTCPVPGAAVDCQPTTTVAVIEVTTTASTVAAVPSTEATTTSSTTTSRPTTTRPPTTTRRTTTTRPTTTTRRTTTTRPTTTTRRTTTTRPITTTTTTESTTTTTDPTTTTTDPTTTTESTTTTVSTTAGGTATTGGNG